MDDEPRKRSRFDQTEPPRKSRFDRRSRSPTTRDSESRPHRTPPPDVKSPGSEGTSNAASAAAAAAARINAQLNAKKGIQHVDVPPIRQTQSPTAGGGDARSPSQPGGDAPLREEAYQQDGDFIKDIEVNDLRNRYTLTKGSTQKMIKEKTGADVTTRGSYFPDKTLATAANPPLYLHVTSTTKEGLEKAIQEIDELMKQELPNLIDERRFRPRREEQPQVERDALGRRKWPEERIPVDLEPIPGFNLRAQVVGAGGSYVKHIQQETRCRVQIKGRGSGFIEHDTGVESDEQMFLHVAGPDPNEVQNAKSMCLDLLASVRQSYDEFKSRPPRGGGGGYGGGYSGGNEDRGGYQHRDRGSGSYGGNGGYGGGNQYGGNNQYGGGSSYGGAPAAATTPIASSYGGAQSPPSASAGATTATNPAEQAQQLQAWAAYYAQNPSADPYAAYGGYATVMAQYMSNPSYYQQQAQQQQSPVGYGANGSAAAPPPPPPADDGNAPPPPPPPAPGAGPGSYNSVPPPPGM